MAGILAVVSLGAGLVAGAAQYPRGVPRDDERFFVLGSTSCRPCHRALFVAWEQSPHARSTDVLGPRQRFDPACEPCHAPDSLASDDGVGCEACHGPGSAYAELDVMIDPLKRRAAGLQTAGDNCDNCHNPGHDFHVARDLSVEARRIHPR